jgi:iron-sulfur cluster insertion protein
MDTTTPEMSFTEAAAKRIKQLIEIEGKPGLNFRLAVSGGGCSGFQYAMTLDDSVTEEDRLFPGYGINVVVDETSLGLLAGTQLDFVSDLMGSSFQVKNPNATATCGCGSSFAV